MTNTQTKRTGGRGRHSSLWRHLAAHHDALAAEIAAEGVSRAAKAAGLAALDLVNAEGRPAAQASTTNP